MLFNFDINLTTAISLAVALAAAAIAITVSIISIGRVSRRHKECDLTADDGLTWPAVSIIVYSQNDPTPLENLLPVILAQNYPANFEVIVVNDGDSVDVRNTVGALSDIHRNLYLTHTPDGARSLSRKKLGITLGIKAARHDIVVLTTTAAVIESPLWLAKMMRHFNRPETGVVLGYAAPLAGDDRGRGACARAFDYAAESIDWLSAATAGHPYRGTEMNLAYRRQLFFDNKGFSRSLNLCAGDDDIFISEIATADNTAVELSEESIVRFGSYDYRRSMREAKLRRRFTESFIRHKPLSSTSAIECALWMSILATTVAVIFSPTNIAVILTVAVAIIAALTVYTVFFRNAMSAIGLRRLRLSIPFLALSHFARRISVLFSSRFSHQKKYTWD